MATVQKRNNSYRITASCGYDSTGKQIRKSITWTPSPGMSQKQIDKELQRQQVLFDEQCKHGFCHSETITLEDFCLKWLSDYAEPNLAPKTVAGYKDKIRRVYTALGHKRLSQIKPAHIMEFYKNLRETGLRGDIKYKALPKLQALMKKKRITQRQLCDMTGLSSTTIFQAVKGHPVSLDSAKKTSTAMKTTLDALFAPVGKNRPLSDKTVAEYHRLLHVIFKTAMRWQYISSNPCDMVTPPKAKRAEAVYLDDVQTRQMLEYLQSEPVKPRTMIYLLLYSGVRRGELCGLFWSDIDFDKQLITIRRSTQYLPGRGIFDKDTKTEASQRTIKLPQAAFDALRVYKAWQEENKLQLGDMWTVSDRVFCDDFGNPISPEYITQWFRKFVRRYDLPPVHIHSLRHTNATLLIAGGVPLRTVSSRLGHTMLSTTGDIYAHAIQASDAAAADLLDDMLHPVQAETINE